jgi:hypothetical protein
VARGADVSGQSDKDGGKESVYWLDGGVGEPFNSSHASIPETK